MSINHATDMAWKSVLENLSFSLYTGASESRDRVADLFSEATRRQAYAQRCGIGFAITSLIFLFVVRLRRGPASASSDFSMTLDLLGIGVICLVAGLLAPILILKAYTTLPVIGEVVLKFEAKSVVTTIETLIRANSYFIALLVAGFSVLTPMVKIVIAILVVQRRWVRWHVHGLEFIKAIGKWSMADVFVVAVLVAYFAASGDEFSEARIGLGLYFFVSYCFISQFATHALMREFASELSAQSSSRAGAEEGNWRS